MYIYIYILCVGIGVGIGRILWEAWGDVGTMLGGDYSGGD